MKKKISVLALASIFAAGSAMASGWRIPEQSVDSTAKAGANVASSTRADAAYYNPANMAWLEDTWQVQLDATWIHLYEIDYTDARTPSSFRSGSSEAENFYVPTGFFVSPSFGGARVGLAITAPAGLSKRWKHGYPKAYAEEFSLEVIEVNPTVSYSFGNMVSIAAGPRMLYSKATVTSNADDLGRQLSRDMDGDTTEWGWNVALAVKPIEKLNISATYRSKVDLNFKDEAVLDQRAVNPLLGIHTFGAEVSVPVPAVFALSVAYDVLDNLNVELTWDRTFWSTYKVLDFNFTPAAMYPNYEQPIPKDWNDSNCFRVGLTWDVNDTLTLMGGFAYDETPVPSENIGFELPDSDAWIYSLGAQYKVTEKMDIGIAALYDYKESRRATTSPDATNVVVIDGEFKDAAALLITVGLNYRF